MARYQFIVLSQAKPGREEEFISLVPRSASRRCGQATGVVSARLYRTDYQKVYTIDAPRWCLLTIYEMESDDPAATVEDIRSKSGLAEMPESDALDKTGMIIVVGHQIGEVT